MRKSVRTVGVRLPVAEGRAVLGAVDLRVYPLFEARVLAGLGVEVHYELALLERVLAEDPDPSVLDLDDVIAGPGVASEARRGGGPGVHDKHVLDPPRVRYVLVPGEDQVHTHVRKKLQDVARIEDNVPLAARAGDRDQVVVHHEDLELVSRVLEATLNKAVVLASHPPVVQVRLRRVDPNHNRLVELDDGIPFPEEPLEVYVADVSGIVVARYYHEVLALEAPHVLGRLLVLLAVTRIREIPRDHDRHGIVVVYLQDRTLQEIRDEVRAPAVDVADLANGQAAICTHALSERNGASKTDREKYSKGRMGA